MTQDNIKNNKTIVDSPDDSDITSAETLKNTIKKLNILLIIISFLLASTSAFQLFIANGNIAAININAAALRLISDVILVSSIIVLSVKCYFLEKKGR